MTRVVRLLMLTTLLTLPVSCGDDASTDGGADGGGADATAQDGGGLDGGELDGGELDGGAADAGGFDAMASDAEIADAAPDAPPDDRCCVAADPADQERCDLGETSGPDVCNVISRATCTWSDAPACEPGCCFGASLRWNEYCSFLNYDAAGCADDVERCVWTDC